MVIKAYIDIDGVLLREGKNGPELIPRFRRVIRFLVSHFDCYWLTTHVRHGSGSAGAVKKLLPYLNRDRVDPAILAGIKPTEWETLKTEAIDYGGLFIWLEDDPFPSELDVLRKNKCTENFVPIDWKRRETRLTVHRLRWILRGRKPFVDGRV